MVILYTTNCPKCRVLETKLNEKNITYTEETDLEVMQQKGFSMAPMLEVNGEIYDFSKAIQWVKNYAEE